MLEGRISNSHFPVAYFPEFESARAPVMEEFSRIIPRTLLFLRGTRSLRGPWHVIAHEYPKTWVSLMGTNRAQFFLSEKPDEANLLKTFGEPGRTRTSNPLIKSQLLYH